jgi:hypothetical protein
MWRISDVDTNITLDDSTSITAEVDYQTQPPQYEQQLADNDSASSLSPIIGETDGFETTLNRVRALSVGDPDDQGLVTANPVSYKIAMRLLYSAGNVLGPDFPRGSAATDEAGGIRITWRQNGREVRLVCPADNLRSPYLYREFGAEYDVDDPAKSSHVIFRLLWLAGY